ncbi:MAG: hypothetical protein E6J90_05040 [Deltaproteobacteria bacterium]|nr:MAG: hypothetical protein E6J91_37305 [Deltaproteobacteria bacterium]TMQ25924.1 MAG: hypothetical protein E6J90_05040 [Deltaproteobacteria bacterium]
MRLSWIVLLAACRPALSFVPDKLPDATVGQPYHATIEVSGGETPVGNISAAPLPSGLTLAYDRSRNGIASIDGTPTTAGRTSITVDAWCYGTNRAGQTGRHVYELFVH